MTKGLEALDNLINKAGVINDSCAHLFTCFKCGKCIFEEPMGTCDNYQSVLTIEKELKVLEIIKNKKVNLFHIWVFDNYEQYKLYYPFAEYHAAKDMLATEEFNFLKEWLENENIR